MKTFSIFTTLPLWQAKSFLRLPGQFVWDQAISPSIQKNQHFFCGVVQQVHKQHEKSHLKNKNVVNAKQRSCKKDNTKRKTVKKNMCNSLGNSYFLIFTFVSQFSKLQYFLFRFTTPTLYLCFFLITDQYNKTCLYVTTCS